MASLRHHESTLIRPCVTLTAALLGIFLALASPVSFAQDDILGELEKKKEQEKKAAAVNPAGGEKPAATAAPDPTETGKTGDQQQPSGESQGNDAGKSSGSGGAAGGRATPIS